MGNQMLQSSQRIMQNYHPSQWLQAIQNEYDTISTTMTSMAQERQRSIAKNQGGIRPQAGSGASGVSDPEPKSLEDHIERDLRRMRGG